MSELHLSHGQRHGWAPRQRIDVEALSSSFNLSDIVSLSVKLKREGNELVGLCPFHEEQTPSFRVNDARGAFYCFGCGARGDLLRFIMDTKRVGFLDAYKWLTGGDHATRPPAVTAAAKTVYTEDRQAKAAHARSIWADAAAVDGTPAETYLRRRGIVTGTSQPELRFARVPVWKDYKTGRSGPNLPALIGAVRTVEGDVVGVQRIFLAEDGSKAKMDRPKLSLGHIAGGALRLGPPPTDNLIVCEGPEDGLTLAQELGMPVWVALGTANLPSMGLPDGVRVVTIAGDNNPPGIAAVAAAAAAFTSQRRTVRTMFPDPMFVDFNDQLQGITR